MVAQLISLLAQCDRVWKKLLGTGSVRRRLVRANAVDTSRIPALIEQLEQRTLLSTANVLASLQANTTYQLAESGTHATSVSYTPSQIQSAYGFNKISSNGSGQTIAIVDAYDAPTIQADLQQFDSRFGIAAPPKFQVMSQTGSTTTLPGTDSSKGWEVEEALDVEWAHALAPGANIVLVEANSASDADLFAAVRTAANLQGVSVVSMSFGGGEFASEASYDSVFTTPNGHQGVTFVASTGDNGAPGGFPAYSSNVLAVGGTTLTIDSSGNYVSESGWSGSGGGISSYEQQPSYQHGVVTQTSTMRAIPDVAFDADPNSGVMICDSFTYGTNNPWTSLGGTSFSAPAWGAIVSIINQSRVQNGLGSLDGATQTLPMIYQLSTSNSSDFHDVTTGNNGHAAGTGYDLVTGLGSPVVNLLVPAMSGTTPSSTSKLAIQSSPTSGTAGSALDTLTVAVQDTKGQVVTSDTSTVKLTLSNGTFSTGSATATATAVNGVASFSGLKINSAGTYTLTASDSQSQATVTTGKLVISPAALNSLSVQQSPTSGTAGVALSPAVKVAALDQYGNLVTTSTSVTLTLTGGTFANGSATVTANTTAGIATFSNLIIKTAGYYTISASSGSLASPSFNLAVSPAAASKIAWQSAPGSTAVAGTTLGALRVAVQDAFGNVITTDNSTVTLTLSSNSFSSNASTVTATAVNGVATFTDLAINTSGTYKIAASDGNSLTSVTSGNVVITPGALSSLVVQQNPTTGTAGVALNPTVKVAAFDQFGNLVTTNTTVTLTLTGGSFASGSNIVTANTSKGIATFSGLIINLAGSYSLTASVDTVSSSAFNLAVAPATAKQAIWQAAPASTVVAGTALTPFSVAVEDAFGNLVTADTTVTLKLSGGKFSTGSATVTATTVHGVATFSSLAINTAGSDTLTANVGSVVTSTQNLTVSPAAASKLVFKTQPVAKAVAGTTLSSVTVAVEDAFGNVVTNNNSTIALTLSNGTFSTGSTFVTATAADGVATFANLAINTAGIYTLTASGSDTLATATSGNLAITPAAFSSLAVQQNPTTGVAGVALAPAVKIAALDQYGNLVATSTPVTLTLTGGTFPNGSTTVTGNTASGIATFANLILKTAGNYTFTASSGSISNAPANSGSISGPSFNLAISPAAASKLVWQSAPSATSVAGTTLGVIRVAVEDAFGNIVQTETSTMTLTLSSNTFSSNATTTTAAVVDGIATFTDLGINAAGTYKIAASDSASSLTVTSGSIVITPGALSSLVVQQNPTTGTAGVALTPTIKVAALDQFGNLLTASTTVTLTLTGGNFASGTNTVTATTTKGVATFSGLIINVAGTYSLVASVDSLSAPSFNLAVAPAAAKQAIWQTEPSATVVAGTALDNFSVAVEDAFGNLVTANTTVTLKLVGGKFSSGIATVTATTVNGIATFSGLAINTAGSDTLTANVGSATTSSHNLTVSPAAASKLVLQTAPVAKAVAGTTLSPVTVAVEDTYGNVVTSNNSTITLTLSSGTFSTGSATVTATAVNGIATFSSLALNTTGTYTVTATGGDSLATATSGNLVISPAAFSSLVIQQNPTTGTAGVALAPAVKVAALDQFGNLVTASTTVTLTLTSGTFSSGKTTVTASTTGGIATFGNLIIKTAGNYVLTASTDTQSGPSFNLTVSPAAASKLVWQTAPVATAITGTTLSPIVVAIEDAFGNVVTTDNSTITLTLNSKTFSSNSSTVTATVVNGIATFTDLAINVLGTYKITASDSNSLTSITSGSLVITPAV